MKSFIQNDVSKGVAVREQGKNHGNRWNLYKLRFIEVMGKGWYGMSEATFIVVW